MAYQVGKFNLLKVIGLIKKEHFFLLDSVRLYKFKALQLSKQLR